MASSKSTIHKRSGTHPPSLWRRYLEMVMATIDMRLRTVTLLLCVCHPAQNSAEIKTQMLSPRKRKIGFVRYCSWFTEVYCTRFKNQRSTRFKKVQHVKPE
jgi:hypothetical protein